MTKGYTKNENEVETKSRTDKTKDTSTHTNLWTDSQAEGSDKDLGNVWVHQRNVVVAGNDIAQSRQFLFYALYFDLVWKRVT